MSDSPPPAGSNRRSVFSEAADLAALEQAMHAAALEQALETGDARLGVRAAGMLARLRRPTTATMDLLTQAREQPDERLADAAATALAAHTPSHVDGIAVTDLAWLAGNGPATAGEAEAVLASPAATTLLGRMWASIHPPLRLLAAAAAPDDDLADATRQLLTTCHTGQCRRCRGTLSALGTTAAHSARGIARDARAVVGKLCDSARGVAHAAAAGMVWTADPVLARALDEPLIDTVVADLDLVAALLGRPTMEGEQLPDFVVSATRAGRAAVGLRILVQLAELADPAPAVQVVVEAGAQLASGTLAVERFAWGGATLSAELTVNAVSAKTPLLVTLGLVE